MSVYLEWTGALPTETVDIEIDADGVVTVFSGTQAMGQGLETTYTQLIEVLGVPAASIRIVQGDTDRANGVGSVGSRSAFVGGSAVVAAGHKMVARLRETAAEALEAATSDIELREGRVRIAGTDRSISLSELAARQPTKAIRVAATETPSTPSWPNGAQVAEVEIDPETGGDARRAHELRRHRPHHQSRDRGRSDPRRHGAGRGPGALGAGALRRGERPAPLRVAHGLCVPRADQLPALAAHFDESVPCKTNLLGVKGCGELGTIGAVPAVVHAVLDALELPHRDAAHRREGLAGAAP